MTSSDISEFLGFVFLAYALGFSLGHVLGRFKAAVDVVA